jgi:hypothetical protein
VRVVDAGPAPAGPAPATDNTAPNDNKSSADPNLDERIPAKDMMPSHFR